jgi:hypothetical protein
MSANQLLETMTELPGLSSVSAQQFCQFLHQAQLALPEIDQSLREDARTCPELLPHPLKYEIALALSTYLKLDVLLVRQWWAHFEPMVRQLAKQSLASVDNSFASTPLEHLSEFGIGEFTVGFATIP